MNIIQNKKTGVASALLMMFLCVACGVPPQMAQKAENKEIPKDYPIIKRDTTNTAKVKWADFFTDEDLKDLIEAALKNNQELNIVLQEVNIAQNEIKARKGEYLPFFGLGAGAGIEKVPKHTSQGKSDELTQAPDPLSNYMFAATASWEVDIWKKLRNAKKAAMLRYLASVEGKNFMITNLVSEIANSYYELIALDNELQILINNIDIQKAALEIVRIEKTSAKTTELAVRRFEAEVLKNQAHQYYIQQEIIEVENRINFLVGRFPQPVKRKSEDFIKTSLKPIYEGLPSDLLQNRPDIKAAELRLGAAKLDIKSAKARFYPSFSIRAGLGYQAFDTRYLITSPESMVYNVVGELVAPLINRNAIKAAYWSANAKQVQAVYDYERSILNAYIEVANLVSKTENLKNSYDMKTKQVEALNSSINISIVLFRSARADYMDVLLTQRDALISKFELVETKMEQITTMISVYKSLGGGWR